MFSKYPPLLSSSHLSLSLSTPTPTPTQPKTSGPPTAPGSRLLDRYQPALDNTIEYGSGSKVGRGGMQQKVDSAAWAWRAGTAVVIANGMRPGVIRDVLQGKKVCCCALSCPFCDLRTL